MNQSISGKILVITTNSSSYPGANAVGQAHMEYSPSTYVIRVPDPVLLPVDFYLKAYSKGIGGIIIMSSGTDCPYEGAYEKLAHRIQKVYSQMKELGIAIDRLKLTTICTVSVSAFIKEIKSMEDNLKRLQDGQ
jgi:F420-non-reducing hydrogenase iron-sulfur subunit